MFGGRLSDFNWRLVLILVTSAAMGGCQATSVDVPKPVSFSTYDVEGTIPADDVLAEGQNSETSQPHFKKVVEWNIAFSNSIMPPAEVRKTIDESCKKIGYDHGVIVSMSLSESKVIAGYDCRGEDAI